MVAKPHRHDKLESTALPGLPFILLTIGVLVFLGGAVGGFWGLFSNIDPHRVPLPAQQPPVPRLQANPPNDLQKVIADQQARLTGYRWVDRDKDIAAIPIERAMQIIAGRGTDAYAPIPGAPPPPPPKIPELLENLRNQPSQPPPLAAPSAQPPKPQP